MKEMKPLINALTIDVEDWYHPELVRSHLRSTSPRGRVSQAILPILHLLDQYQVKASFFILGDVARQCPDLVREIYEKGHELGCHGMSHRMLEDLGEEGLRKELMEFKKLISEILGDLEIKGFRAPTFSLNQKTKWALPILREFGYLYDASLFPVKFFGNRLYGVEKAPRFPYRICFDNPSQEDPKSPLWEFPAAVLQLGRLKIPISGGFYLRSLPGWFLKWALKQINREGPFNLYLHPWECDIHTPRVPLPFSSKWITYYGIHRAIKKLEELVKQFSFSRVDRVLKDDHQ
jgi:polysaccharide deacetylase family protein (PEP-CTERM system associated)